MSAEIDTLGQLLRAVALGTFGGYDVQVTINQEHSGGGFLIVGVSLPLEAEAYIGQPVSGEWWFDADDRVMQVL